MPARTRRVSMPVQKLCAKQTETEAAIPRYGEVAGAVGAAGLAVGAGAPAEGANN